MNTMWEELRQFMRRGLLAQLYLDTSPWTQGSDLLWRRWPRAPLDPEQIATTLESSPDEVSSTRSLKPLARRVHELALQRGPLVAASTLWSMLRERDAPLPLEWRQVFAPLPPLPHSLKTSTRDQSRALDPEKISELRWLLADLLLASGQKAVEVIPPLISIDPSSPQSIIWLTAQPTWSPLSRAIAQTPEINTLERELNPESVIRAYKAQPWSPLSRGRLGQLLDHQALYLLPNGEGLRWVTEVIRVNNREGVEELGELRLPQTAQLISLYHRKALGGYRAPLRILATGGYSFSDLQVGDFLVASYVEPVTSERIGGGVLTPRIPLVDLDRALGLRVIRILSRVQEGQVAPQVWIPPASDLKAERYVNKSYVVPDGRLIHVMVKRAPPLKREPASPSARLTTPSVQVGDALSPIRERQTVSRWIHRRVVADVDLCRKARLFIETQRVESDKKKSQDQTDRTPQEQRRAFTTPLVEELASLVAERVQRETTLLDAPRPSDALARGVGHRGLTLSALMNDCGYTHELWLARRREQLHDPTFERLDDFDHLLIRWRGHWIDPQLMGAPIGVISDLHAGGAATPIWPIESAAVNTSPLITQRPSLVVKTLPWLGAIKGSVGSNRPQDGDVPPIEDLTHSARGQLKVDWMRPLGVLSAHALSGSMTHRFTGADGFYLHQRMKRASPEELKGWVERQWTTWWGPTEVRGVEISYEGGAAILRYQLLVWARPKRDLSPAPQLWGKRFASQERRRHPLSVPIVRQEVTLELHGVTVERDELDEMITLPNLKISRSEMNTPHFWVASPLAPTPEQLIGSFRLQVKSKSQKPKNSSTQATEPITVLSFRWSLNGGLIDRRDYSKWRAFARRIDQLERVKVQIKRTTAMRTEASPR